MELMDALDMKIAEKRKERLSKWTTETSYLYDRIVEKIEIEINNYHCFESTLESFRNFLILARNILNTKEEDIPKDEYVSSEMKLILKEVNRLTGRTHENC